MERSRFGGGSAGARSARLAFHDGVPRGTRIWPLSPWFVLRVILPFMRAIHAL